jgi:ankyrin repeat protein
MYKLKYSKYYNKLKQLGGLNYSGPDDKLLVLLQRCGENGFMKEVQPFLNLTRLIRNNTELYTMIKNKDEYLKYFIYTKNTIRLDFLMKRCRFTISRNLKLLLALNVCKENGFTDEVRPLVNLNKLFRHDLELWKIIDIETINKLFECANMFYHEDRIIFLLKLGANPNYPINPHFGYGSISPICNAIENINPIKRRRIVELLIQYGADLNYILHNDYFDRSLLMYAIDLNSFDIAEILIMYRANLDYISEHTGETAFTKLIDKNQFYLVQLMIQEDANINYRNSTTGKTLLIYLMEANQLELMQIILNKGANINEVDKLNRTALYYAEHLIQFNKKKIKKLLLSYGAEEYEILDYTTKYSKINQRLKNKLK